MTGRGFGPERARIMIVGEAPNAEAMKARRPFAGKVLEALRSYLMETGLDPDDIYYSNVCFRRPSEDKLDRFFLKGMPNEHVVEGMVALQEEILAVRPNVILACGNYALWALTGKAQWYDRTVKGERVRGFSGIQDWRGSILHCTLAEGFKVIPTFHPEYIMKEGMKDHGTFKVDLDRLKREAEFPEIRRPEKSIVLVDLQPKLLTNYQGVVDRDEDPNWQPVPMNRFEIKDILLSTPDIPTTLDIEYIGSKLLCVGLTNSKDQAFVLPTERLGDVRYMEEIVNSTKQFNAQNSMFDASILEWHYGIKIMERVTYDTMLAASAANVELPKGLDYLVSIYSDQPYYKSMVNWDKIKRGLQPLSQVYAYNGIDVWTQHEVMEEQIKWDLPEKCVNDSFQFMMRLLTPLWNMSKRGIRIDLDLMKNVGKMLEDEAAMKAFELMFMANRTDLINVKSNKEIGALLYDQLGLPVIKMNKTGPACDDKTLAALQLKATTDEQRNAITIIRQIRNARDLKSKFFNIAFDDDGRMRGHYDPTKTVTGRLASRKFYPTGKGTNQQNIPRDKRARRAFIADPRKVFGYADLEKAESLVVAHLTGDVRMLFDHSLGQNAHKNLGSALFKKPASELTDDEYYLSKKTRHAGNYMQGWMTFMRNVNQDAHKTGVSIEAKEAKYFIQTYKDLHPRLPSWWKEIERKLWEGRTLYNLIGRKRIFYGHIKGILPEAVAFTPQSTVGDTLNLGLLNLEGIPSPYMEERGLWSEYKYIGEELRDCGYESLQQIHDAVGFQCWEKDLDRAVPLIRRAMMIPLTNPKTYEDFTIRAEVAVDLNPEHIREWKSNWGDCKTYTKDLEKAA